MEIIYRCECCQVEFDNEDECLEHEDECCEGETEQHLHVKNMNKKCRTCQRFQIEELGDNTYKIICLSNNRIFMECNQAIFCEYYSCIEKVVDNEIFI